MIDDFEDESVSSHNVRYANELLDHFICRECLSGQAILKVQHVFKAAEINGYGIYFYF